MNILIFATHPIQYQVPLYRELAKEYNLTVVYMHNQKAGDQGRAGFGVDFKWDIPLFEGYNHYFARNLSRNPSTSKFFGIRIFDLKSIFEKFKPDKVIVQGWFPFAYLQVILYCSKNEIQLIGRGDSNLLMKSGFLKRFLKKMYMSWLLPHFDKFLTVGKRNEDFYRYYGVLENKLFFAPHSVNTNFFKQEYEKLKKENRNKIRIGFAGKFIDIKQPILLIEAVNKSLFKSDIEIVFIGDGPLKESMRQLGEQYQIGLYFTGFLNQTKIVSDGYALIDVLVVPSVHETWALVVNEVMTGGIPVIVSDLVGCAPDLVSDGHTGYVFKSGDVKDLANKINLMVERIISGFDFKSEVFERINHFSMDNTKRGILEALNAK